MTDRVKIALPEKFLFDTEITVQIGDINYGGHLSNDAVLRLCHEVRLRFLQSLGYSETDVEGIGLIMADAAVRFIRQAFRGDVLRCRVGVLGAGRSDFAMFTGFSRLPQEEEIARVKTGMVFFDYVAQKVCPMPAAFAAKIAA